MNAKLKSIIPKLKIDFSKPWLKFFAKALLVALVLGSLIIILTYHLAYSERIYPDVKAGEFSLGNRNFEEAVVLLEAYFDRFGSRSLVFKVNAEQIEIPLAESGLVYQASETAQLAMAVGREGGFLERLREKWLAWHYGRRISPVIRVDESIFDDKVDYLANLADDPGTSTEVKIISGKVFLVPPKPGIALDRSALRQEILTALGNFSFDPLAVPMRKISPTVDKEGVKEAQEFSQKILEAPLKLSYEGRSWVPIGEELLGLLSYEPVAGTASAEKGVLAVSPNQPKISVYLSQIAKEIDQEPLEERFQLVGERLASFQPAREGKKLNREKSLKDISQTLSDLSLPREIALEVSTITAPPSPETNSLGIRDLLGEGVSNFKGSIQGRINNIVLASSRLNGILVPPGEEFSFNHYLGDVEPETGYSAAYVIREGRTVLGTGGGVCQVSTTLFRAVLNSGLPILKRTAHAYRVHYYEPPAGFDATVYAPSVDFVFKNDTPSHILIQSSAYIPSTTLIFRIYGTNDQRKIIIQGPFIAYETPPPEPEYVDDPALPKGQVKQIDWAVWGADVTVKRTVTRGQDVLSEDTFRSIYQPWKAVYLRGTKK